MRLLVKYRYTSPKWMFGISAIANSQTKESKVCQVIRRDLLRQYSDSPVGCHTEFGNQRIDWMKKFLCRSAPI